MFLTIVYSHKIKLNVITLENLPNVITIQFDMTKIYNNKNDQLCFSPSSYLENVMQIFLRIDIRNYFFI